MESVQIPESVAFPTDLPNVSTENSASEASNLVTVETLTSATTETPTSATTTETPTSATTETATTVTAEKPIEHPNIYGLSGLMNQINTCYMNSAVQTLAHIYPLVNYLLVNKKTIVDTLLSHAPKILHDNSAFDVAKYSIVPMELKKKLADEAYAPSQLEKSEIDIILNHTITFQFIKIVERMWQSRCVINPTSFKKVFSEARTKFFFGYEQHDSEEAYTCILEKMQSELGSAQQINFTISNPEFNEFLKFKQEIADKVAETDDPVLHAALEAEYENRKTPDIKLILDSCLAMRNHYEPNYSRIMELFTGFEHSSINCPTPGCGNVSHCIHPLTHLSVPILTPPVESVDDYQKRFQAHRKLNLENGTNIPFTTKASFIELEECMKEYCKEETLDEDNAWACEKCNLKVKAVKCLKMWRLPPVLVIQLKRFNPMTTHKNSTFVKYPMDNFDVKFMMDSVEFDPNCSTTYRLHSVICHEGVSGGGHYYCYNIDPDTGLWFKYNDRFVHKIDPKKVITPNAYLVVYVREDHHQIKSTA